MLQQYRKIGKTIYALWQGLWLTSKHLYASMVRMHASKGIAQPDYFEHQDGAVTLPYPHEALPVPPRGRYKLHNAIDDCIVCDKCVRVCPVDCIEIEAIPSPTVIGETSNGMKKRIYAAKFDIDMAKCCFCGLCTTVCPTACLTMTPEYDFSVFDFVENKVGFADMTPDAIQEKQQAWENHLTQQKVHAG